VLLLAVGCTDRADAGTDPAALEGVDWELDAASAGSLVDRVPAGAQVSLRFGDGQAHGRSACNDYGASYEADDGVLSFGQMQMTAMACEERVMALEAVYLDALSKVSGYQVSTAGLALTGGEVVLTFTDAGPSSG
jgi:heat shock protein HslJ